MKKFNLTLNVLEKDSDIPILIEERSDQLYTSMRYAKSAIHQLANRRIRDFGHQYHVVCMVTGPTGIMAFADFNAES
jgi:hypothetical protein